MNENTSTDYAITERWWKRKHRISATSYSEHVLSQKLNMHFNTSNLYAIDVGYSSCASIMSSLCNDKMFLRAFIPAVCSSLFSYS